MNVICIIIFILPIFLSCLADDGYCDDRSWLKFNGNCYSFEKDRLSYYDAEDLCRSKGSHLISIHSEVEHQFVIDKINRGYGGSRRWIGLTVENKDYQWSDATEVDYLKIAPKTQYVKEKCHVFFMSEGWRPEHCELRYPAICKKSVDAVTPTPIPPITTLTPEGNCPSGWLQYNHKCYKFFGAEESERLQYKEAKNACLKLGDEHDLVSVHSMGEQAFLVQELANFGSSVWIGLNHIESDEIGHISVFGWTDNSRVDFTNWALGHPKPGTWKYCVRLNYEGVSKGQWLSDYCGTSKYGYVCSRPSVPTSTPPPVNPSNCKEGFTGYRNSCYKLYSTEETWENAEGTCKEQGGHLMSITDSFEEAFLYNFLGTQHISVWNGLTTIKNTRIFQWVDEWPFYYSNWAVDQPKLSDIDSSMCAFTSIEPQEWNVTNCSERLPFICKITSDTPPTFPSNKIGKCMTNEKELFDIGDQFCYHVPKNDRLQWGQLSRYCVTKGMEMVTAYSEHQMNMLMTYLWKKPYYHWLGLIRNFSNGDFMWVDYSSLNYTNWDIREPQSGYENYDCVGFSTETSKWAVKSCSDWLGAICRVKKL